MAAPSEHKRVVTSYLLWVAGFVGIAGLHRLYNGKIFTGLLWFFTGGLLGVGQFIDVFFVPGMAEHHQLKLWAKYGGHNPYDGNARPAVTTTIPTLSDEEKMVKLLKAATKYEGQLSVTKAVMETGLSFEETEGLLKDMVKKGYVGVTNHPSTGVMMYHFDELVV
ncbi:MAG: NINE protein [Leptolyngbya sp.]|nr:NINE protein [Leptolyngbya sp.]